MIVSDTHGQHRYLQEVIEKEEAFDLLLHLGDVQGGEREIEAMVDCPVVMVSGNNDFTTTLKKEQELTLGNYRVWMTHGHTYGVSYGENRIQYEARKRGYQVVLFGHTHRPFYEETDIFAVNPGSISYPRQGGYQPTYVVWEIDEAGQGTFQFKVVERDA